MAFGINPPTREQIAKACKEKRKALGISMRDAAKQLHVAPSTYSRIESGKRMTIESWAAAIEWSFEYLYNVPAN